MNEIRGIYQASIHPGQINIWYEPLQRHGRRSVPAIDCEDSQATTMKRPVQFTDNGIKES